MHQLQTTDFCRDDTPWCYFVAAPIRSAEGLARNLDFAQPFGDQRVVVRILRGHRCATSQAVFQEWAAALQFPYYFGENWDALDECLTDLEWLPGSCYVFFVMRLDRVLPGLDDEFNIFIDVLREAHQEWKIPNRYNTDWPAAPFTLVFHTELDQANDALVRLRKAGADPVESRFSVEFIEETTRIREFDPGLLEEPE